MCISEFLIEEEVLNPLYPQQWNALLGSEVEIVAQCAPQNAMAAGTTTTTETAPLGERSQFELPQAA
jgi:hypothetical protein